jgi:2-methylcitrate dehydratase PrpD
MSQTTGATARLAAFTAELDLSRVPPAVVHQAKRCLVDWLGVTLNGAADPGVDILLGVADAVAGRGADGGPNACTVIGRGRRASMPYAALVNGYAAHVADYDDTYNPGTTTVHGSAPVWPVVAALCEQTTTTGRDALAAFIAGFESQVRIARAAGPAHYNAGWHVTGTVGHFGASAAAAKLLRLPAATVAAAFGTAGTQAAGLKEVYGSMGKALHPGKAAMDGLLSAMMAQRGFTSTDTIVEGARGFLHVLTDQPTVDEVTEGLGTRWMLPDNGFKFYACGSLTHPTIECVLTLRARHSLHPDDVSRIEATVHDYVSWVTAKRDLRSGLDGKFSIFHSAAVALVDGKAGLDQFSDARVADPAVEAVRQRVHIIPDGAIGKDAATVVITLTDGRQITHAVKHNKGTPDSPLTDDEIGEKFLDLATPVLGGAEARAVLSACWAAEELDDMGHLIRRAAGPAGAT